MIDGDKDLYEDEEDDFSDLEPGPNLEPMEMTPERQKRIDEAAERLKQRFGHLKKSS